MILWWNHVEMKLQNHLGMLCPSCYGVAEKLPTKQWKILSEHVQSSPSMSAVGAGPSYTANLAFEIALDRMAGV